MLPSEQGDVENFASQSRVRKTSRKPKPVEKHKSVSFKSSDRSGKTSRLPEKPDICETANEHEVPGDQSRMDLLEGLLLSSTQQNREFRDLMMSSLGVEPVLDYPEYIYPLQDPEEGEIPSGQVAPPADSAALVVAEDESWGFCDDAPKGRPLAEAVASNVKCLFLKKMDDKKIGDTAEKYATPENVECLRVPAINEEIWGPMSGKLRTQDLKAQKSQKYLIKGITALLSNVEEVSDAQKDAVALLVAANNELNFLRRELVKPDLNSKLLPLCKSTNPVTQYLFGDDFTKNMRELEAQQKTTAMVMKSQGMFHRGLPYRRPFTLPAGRGRSQFTQKAFTPRPFLSNLSRQFPQNTFRGRARMRRPPYQQSHTGSSGPRIQ